MIKISPDGKQITDEQLLDLFRVHGALRESVFRRYEMNEVIQYTAGTGVDIGCGLNKIHAAAIGIDKKLSSSDFGYPFGAQVRADGSNLSWFSSKSLDYVFSSHCLEHFHDAAGVLGEWIRVIRPGGYLVLIMPHKQRYPNVGTPGANTDHKHDYDPDDIAKLVDGYGFRIAQSDTLYDRLRDNPWSKTEAAKYGHKDLNFSFEIVAKRVLKD
ncbi:MAG TPA: class I SAM-dependent methyltransferase [Candidatus Bathyarchaeia archaeon]|nr:class I SAM-dependent methyltransferase [Candidatus Bathyarchaeia archaeon]